MNETYDFSAGKRGPVAPTEYGKTRITIRLDNDVIDWFRQQVNDAGGGNYQTLINATLRDQMQRSRGTLLEDTLRKVIREELRAAS